MSAYCSREWFPRSTIFSFCNPCCFRYCRVNRLPAIIAPNRTIITIHQNFVMAYFPSIFPLIRSSCGYQLRCAKIDARASRPRRSNSHLRKATGISLSEMEADVRMRPSVAQHFYRPSLPPYSHMVSSDEPPETWIIFRSVDLYRGSNANLRPFRRRDILAASTNGARSVMLSSRPSNVSARTMSSAGRRAAGTCWVPVVRLREESPPYVG